MLQQLLLTAAVSCAGINYVPASDVAYKPDNTIAAPTINPIVAPRIDHLAHPITIEPLKGREAGGKPLRGKTVLGTATESPNGLILALAGAASQLVGNCTPEPQRVTSAPKPTRTLHKPLQR